MAVTKRSSMEDWNFEILRNVSPKTFCNYAFAIGLYNNNLLWQDKK